MDKMKKAPNLDGMVLCDPDKIQTCNRWSRNPVRYSVAPQGHFQIKIPICIAKLILLTRFTTSIP
jgi:hypothetical protein|tara:strand:+ start:240 stop:434 length:195 start_codon:yes stop_codon:yes gene_type:complete